MNARKPSRHMAWRGAWLCMFLCVAVPAWGAPGDDDVAFGDAGTVRISAESVHYGIFGVQPLPGGALVGVGYEFPLGTGPRVALFWLDENGIPDTSKGAGGIQFIDIPFDPETQFVSATAITRLASGELFVAGRLGSSSGSKPFLARLDAAGSLLGVTFPEAEYPESADVGRFDAQYLALYRLQPGITPGIDAERVLLVARSQRESGDGFILQGVWLGRFFADGTVDTGFGDGDGMLTWERPVPPPELFESVRLRRSWLDAEQRINLLLYTFASETSGMEVLVTRLLADGSPDPAFGAQGVAQVQRPAALEFIDTGSVRRQGFGVHPADGKVYVALTSGSNGDVYLLRLNTDGSSDTAFGTAGASAPVPGALARLNDFCGMVMLDDGRVLVLGDVNINGGPLWRVLGWEDTGARLGTDGFSFGAKTGAYQFPSTVGHFCHALARDDQGRIIAAGQYFDTVGGIQYEGLLARFLADGEGAPPPPAPGAFRFPQAAMEASEGAGTIKVLVERIGGSDGEVSVRYYTEPGTATSGSDYLPVDGTLVFGNGQITADIEITLLDDEVFEGDTPETFRVVLSDPTGGATLASPAEILVSILDNDFGADLELSFAAQALRNAGTEAAPEYFADYTLRLRNHGPEAATTARVTLAFLHPERTEFETASVPDGTTFDAAAGEWELGSLGQGQARDLVLAYRVLAGPTIVLSATASTATDDPVAANDTAAAALALPTPETPVRDLAISVSGPARMNNGDMSSLNATFEFAVRNTGTVTVPAGVVFEFSATSPLTGLSLPMPQDASCQELAPRVLRCTTTRSLEPGDQVIARTQAQALRGISNIGTGAYQAILRYPDDDLSNNVVDGSFELYFDTKGAFCFIATAAYGSWMEPQVVTLRAFRDRWLLTHAPGRLLVRAYYRWSPPLAAWIAEREWARALVRGLLAPVLWAMMQPGMAFALVFGAGIVAAVRRRRARFRPACPPG